MSTKPTSAPEKRRDYKGPAFFSFAYRPFFFSAALFAGLGAVLWMAAFSHGYALGPNGNALGWHAHEMLYGYIAGVVAGFVLTAIPNWTGRMPAMGTSLALLFLLWLAGRVMMLFGGHMLVSAVVDCLFLVTLAALVWREIVAGKNWRNLPICVIISLFAISNILDHASQSPVVPDQLGWHMGLALVTLLMMLIGGRVIPSFTTNWMKKQGLTVLPIPFGSYDKIALLIAGTTLTAWVMLSVFPSLSVNSSASSLASLLVGYGFLLAGLLHLIRLARWRGWRTYPELLVLILHIAYAWIPVAFLLMGAAILWPDLLTSAHALHALTAGAAGQLTLAIMTRASLGHSGKTLHAGPGTALAYLLVFLGAALRVCLPFANFDYVSAMSVAAAIWAAGFLVFCAVYAPLLFAPRR